MAVRTDILARDLMQAQVVTLRPDSSLHEALETLEEHEITGAPVVDVSGRPVGFLTMRDVARSEHLSGDRLRGVREGPDLPELPTDETEDGMLDEDSILEREGYSAALLGQDAVQDWMSEDVTAVAPADDLRTVCRTMTENGIHRVLVLENERIVGIITTMDIVRHLAH